MKNSILVFIVFPTIFLCWNQCCAQDSFRNVISTVPFSPLFYRIQLNYMRQIDTTIHVGIQARLCYGAPDNSYEISKNSGVDVSFFARFMARKKAGGLYFQPGIVVGSYSTGASYGEYTVQGWFFGDYKAPVYVLPRSFFAFGVRMLAGCEVVIHRFDLDFSIGANLLFKSSSVTDPVNGYELKKAFYDFDYATPVNCSSISMGYRF